MNTQLNSVEQFLPYPFNALATGIFTELEFAFHFKKEYQLCIPQSQPAQRASYYLRAMRLNCDLSEKIHGELQHYIAAADHQPLQAPQQTKSSAIKTQQSTIESHTFVGAQSNTQVQNYELTPESIEKPKSVKLLRFTLGGGILLLLINLSFIIQQVWPYPYEPEPIMQALQDYLPDFTRPVLETEIQPIRDQQPPVSLSSQQTRTVDKLSSQLVSQSLSQQTQPQNLSGKNTLLQVSRENKILNQLMQAAGELNIEPKAQTNTALYLLNELVAANASSETLWRAHLSLQSGYKALSTLENARQNTAQSDDYALKAQAHYKAYQTLAMPEAAPQL